MYAPLYHTLCTLAQQGGVRMHMPGHKGRAMTPLFSAAAIDYTEIPPTGNLYTGEGPVALAEEAAAAAWGAEHAYFLTGGSTQGIMASLALCAAPGSTILLDRNTHRSFFNAMALLDLHPVYLYEPTAEHISAALVQHSEIQTVCITSPTYYGVISDIAAAAAVCREHGAKLFVDEAHGAHFPFAGAGSCAVGHGASICVCSAHKTLPALGSGALLLTDSSFSPAAVREKTAMFGTSSPSYAVMASIDWARAYLEGEGGRAYRRCAGWVHQLRTEINRRNVFHALSSEDGLALDPTRLTINTARAGLDGRRAGALLEQQFQIWPEMDNRDCIVCILTCSDTEADIGRLTDALKALEVHAGDAPLPSCGAPPEPDICCSVRSAVFSPRASVPLENAGGRISAVSIAPYPPGVPVVAPGERITPSVLSYLTQIGYDMSAPVSVLSKGVQSG